MHSTLAQLIAKYDRPGPRYTSYPTAVQFSNPPPMEVVERELESSIEPLSLYLHLPFCETLCWFCGCNTIITKDFGRAAIYRQQLGREMDLLAKHLQPGRPVTQLHFGGGTPNFFPPADIVALGGQIKQNFSIAESAECAVELAPSHLSEEHVEAFAAIGMKRASFGIQDIDPRVQELIHRHQPHSQNIETMGWLRRHGFNSVNIDLIYGLPGQTPASFERTLKAVTELEPERLAVFSYAHVPWLKPAQKKLEKAGLPTAPEKIELLCLVIDYLTSHGYVYIGMDHFAKPDDELALARENGSLRRNFQGYSTRGGTEIAAFGISAISQTRSSYYQNTKDIGRYGSSLGQGQLPVERGIALTPEDMLRRDVITATMCKLRVEWQEIARRWSIDPPEYFAGALSQLREMEEDGLVLLDASGLTVTEPGRLFLRNIAMCFDAYLQAATTGNRFSRTV